MYSGMTGLGSERLKVFCHLVMKTEETPSLISLVASEAEYLQFCRDIINPDDKYRKGFLLFCRSNQLDSDIIRNRLGVVATVLKMNKNVDYYGILGVPPNADQQTIKQAYRKKAQRIHPDKAPGDQKNSDKFIELHAAYAQLSDPGLRRLYDQMCHHDSKHWVENEATLSKPPAHRRGIGHFISWMSILIGGLVFIAFVFDVYKKQSIHHSPQPPDMAQLSGYSSKSFKIRQKIEAPGDAPTSSSEMIRAPVETQNHATAEALNFSAKEARPEIPESDRVSPVKIAADHAAAHKAATVPLQRVTHRTLPIEDKKKPAKIIMQRTVDTPPKAADSVEVTIRLAEEKKESSPKRESAPDEAESPKPNRVLPVEISQISGTQTNQNDEELYLLQKKRVSAFLDNFTKTYEKRELEHFKTFFTKDALEQGIPFESLLSTYQKTFNSVDDLKYHIDITLFRTEKDANKHIVEGDFVIRYRLPEKDWHNRSGTIRIELLDSANGLMVRRLNYEVRR